MYFIAYAVGRRLCDGYAPTVESALAQFPGTFESAGTLGDEEKWQDTSGVHNTVVYIRPRGPAQSS